MLRERDRERQRDRETETETGGVVEIGTMSVKIIDRGSDKEIRKSKDTLTSRL